jgi:hypothetical protein
MGDEQVRALVQCDGRNRALLPDGDHGAGLGHGKERDRFRFGPAAVSRNHGLCGFGVFAGNVFSMTHDGRLTLRLPRDLVAVFEVSARLDGLSVSECGLVAAYVNDAAKRRRSPSIGSADGRRETAHGP